MVKTYKNNDGITFKGLQYTGKNLKEFHDILNDPDNKMGIFVRLGSNTIVLEDAQSLFFSFYGRQLELKKSDHFLYSQESGLFGVFNSTELKEEFEQVK